ncbi:MAG: ABC transporter [Deltaproteobacteria bacterium]|jgi:phospholipid-binding lipoprotein MlaA|nr:ABC transporter [Deltaproteobacteria bacterium]
MMRAAGRRRNERKPLGILSVLLLGVALTNGCATNGPDPYEETNLSVFAFNEGVDRIILEPVAKGWDFVLPDFVQTGIGNFFDNLRMIRTGLNDLLQGKPGRAGTDMRRFLVNSTVGIVGLVDVASMAEIPHYREDFGQTLGVWGFGPGSYLVVPFLGPSSSRDLLAWPIDLMTVPTAYGVSTLDVINARAKYLEEIADNRKTALDYYVFVRNAYLQARARQVADGEEDAEEEDEDFYDLEDDEPSEPAD